MNLISLELDSGTFLGFFVFDDGASGTLLEDKQDSRLGGVISARN